MLVHLEYSRVCNVRKCTWRQNLTSAQEHEQYHQDFDPQHPNPHQHYHQPYISPPSEYSNEPYISPPADYSNQPFIPSQSPVQRYRPYEQPLAVGRRQQKKKHKCELCGGYFLRPSTLQTHIRTHTGERPFPCPFPDCPRDRHLPGRAFGVESNMTRHCKTCHKGQEPPRNN
jgi:uncharacterized Zn-finger protein